MRYFTLLNNLTNKYIGESIKKARKEKNITREKLAELVNIDEKQIYRIECGLSSPKLENFLKIATALDLKIEYFEEINLPQNNICLDFLKILQNSTEKELELYLDVIKTIKKHNAATNN